MNSNYIVKLETLSTALKYTVKENERLEKELLDAQQKIKNYENFYSYKLGRLIVDSKSLKGIILLPINIYKLNRDFKKYKKNILLSKADKLIADHNIRELENRKIDGRVKLIAILDEISFVSWSNEFSLFELNINKYAEQIETSTSHGLFLESCWNGNFGRWQYAFTSPGLKHANAQHLLSAIDKANKKNMPIIFWNKEDPMHYDKFLPIAEKCDIVFTTDENKVKDYERDIPNAKIGVLPFAANVELCNPKDRFRNKQPGTICFAGSYYTVGHGDRKKQMDDLLPTIPAFNGTIYDRMSKVEGDRYAYPSKYNPFIKPAVPFQEVISVYKKFKIFLNVNTIVDSPTMMSRRVYELLACGTPVISTPSLAIEKQFPGIVQIAKNSEEAIKIANKLLNDEREWSKLSHLGYREVMLRHTYEDRAKIIERTIGNIAPVDEPLVSIIMATNRPHFIERIVNNIACQKYKKLEAVFILQNYSKADVLLLKNLLDERAEFLCNIEIILDDSEATLGARLNRAGKISKGEYIAKMDDDDLYFDNYFIDMLLPFKFTDCGIVGKKEVFVYLEGENKTVTRYQNERHKITDFIAGPTIIISRTTFNKIQFGDKNQGEDSSLLASAKEHKINIYSSDPYNFIQWRSKERGHHTWQVGDEFFLSKGNYVSDGIGKEIANI